MIDIEACPPLLFNYRRDQLIHDATEHATMNGSEVLKECISIAQLTATLPPTWLRYLPTFFLRYGGESSQVTCELLAQEWVDWGNRLGVSINDVDDDEAVTDASTLPTVTYEDVRNDAYPRMKKFVEAVEAYVWETCKDQLQEFLFNQAKDNGQGLQPSEWFILNIDHPIKKKTVIAARNIFPKCQWYFTSDNRIEHFLGETRTETVRQELAETMRHQIHAVQIHTTESKVELAEISLASLETPLATVLRRNHYDLAVRCAEQVIAEVRQFYDYEISQSSQKSNFSSDIDIKSFIDTLPGYKSSQVKDTLHGLYVEQLVTARFSNFLNHPRLEGDRPHNWVFGVGRLPQELKDQIWSYVFPRMSLVVREGINILASDSGSGANEDPEQDFLNLGIASPALQAMAGEYLQGKSLRMPTVVRRLKYENMLYRLVTDGEVDPKDIDEGLSQWFNRMGDFLIDSGAKVSDNESRAAFESLLNFDVPSFRYISVKAGSAVTTSLLVQYSARHHIRKFTNSFQTRTDGEKQVLIAFNSWVQRLGLHLTTRQSIWGIDIYPLGIVINIERLKAALATRDPRTGSDEVVDILDSLIAPSLARRRL